MARSSSSIGTIFWFASTVAAVIQSVASPAAGFVQNGSDVPQSQILETPFPYNFPNMEDPLKLFPMPLCNGLTLEEATIDQLQDAMSHGKLTSTQLITCYLQRIYQTDSYIKYVVFHRTLLLLYLYTSSETTVRPKRQQRCQHDV